MTTGTTLSQVQRLAPALAPESFPSCLRAPVASAHQANPFNPTPNRFIALKNPIAPSQPQKKLAEQTHRRAGFQTVISNPNFKSRIPDPDS
jgi:hypothetical protein